MSTADDIKRLTGEFAKAYHVQDETYVELMAAVDALATERNGLLEALRGLLEIEDARIATGAFTPNDEARKRIYAARAAVAGQVTEQHCTLGVGCESAVVCYAMAHGEPDRCGARAAVGGEKP
jgi:hypothetical protein